VRRTRGDPDASTPPPGYREVLKSRPFFWLWLSQTVSLSGNFIFYVAVVWFVLSETGSVVDVGVLTAAEAIPIVVASPVLGVAVDRFDLRRIVVSSNVAQGVLTALFVLLALRPGPLFLPFVVFVVLVLSTGQTAVSLAIRAALPRLVSLAQLGPANALFSLSSSSNQLIGYGVGGIVVAALGPLFSVGYDSATFFVAAGLAFAIGASALVLTSRSDHPGRGSIRREYREGWRAVLAESWLGEVILLGLAVNFFTSGFVALFAPYVEEVLRAGSTEYGLLLASVAIGGAAGAFVTGRLGFRRFPGRLQVLCILAEGCAVVGLGLVRQLPAALAFGVVVGFCPAAGNVAIGSLIQARVPKGLLGRVYSVTSLTLGAGPFGAILFGYLGARFSISSALLTAGVGIVAWATLALLTFRGLTRASY
jgi:MFS family permease